MNYILLIIYLGISLLIICWAFQRRDRIYQLPFFVVLGFTFFISPQLVGLYIYPFPLSFEILDNATLMSIFCLLACWISYEIINVRYINFKSLNKNLICNVDRLFTCGITFTIIGNFFFILIGNLDPELTASSTPTGLFSLFIFLGRLIYPGFALLLLPTLRSPSFIRIFLCSIAALQPLTRFLIFGRRSELLIFISIVLLIIYFTKNIIISKKILIICFTLGFIFGISIGQYRNIVSTYQITVLDLVQGNGINRVISGFTSVDWLENFQSSFSNKNRSSEIRYAASAIEAIQFTNDYGFGSTYWNTLVFNYIPAQFFGREFKESLYLPTSDIQALIISRFGVKTFSTGLTITCIGELFIQFWYFGSLVFCIISYIFKHLWVFSTKFKNTIGQIFYALMLPFSIIAVGAATANLFSQFIYYSVILMLVLIYSRIPPSRDVGFRQLDSPTSISHK